MEVYLTRLLISVAPVAIFVFFLLLYIEFVGFVEKRNRPFIDTQAQTPAHSKGLQDEQKRIADSVDQIPTAVLPVYSSGRN